MNSGELPGNAFVSPKDHLGEPGRMGWKGRQLTNDALDLTVRKEVNLLNLQMQTFFLGEGEAVRDHFSCDIKGRHLNILLPSLQGISIKFLREMGKRNRKGEVE